MAVQKLTEVIVKALPLSQVGQQFVYDVAQPSQADELLTRQLKDALALVDVRVLDHFIIAGRATLSFAERGLL